LLGGSMLFSFFLVIFFRNKRMIWF
jgi:hypothetical protein